MVSEFQLLKVMEQMALFLGWDTNYLSRLAGSEAGSPIILGLFTLFLMASIISVFVLDP